MNLYLPSIYGNAIEGVAKPEPNLMEQALYKLASSHPQQGRPALVWHPLLWQVAHSYCMYMALRGFEAHVDPDGFGPNHRVLEAGYRLPDYYSRDKDGNYNAKANTIESLQWGGVDTAIDAWDLWLGSAPHRVHLLAENRFYAEQTNVAFGYHHEPQSRWGHYYCFLSAPREP